MNSFEEGFMAGFLINYKKSSEDEETPVAEEWKYPSNWLKLPEPKSNEIILLLENRALCGVYNDYNGESHDDGFFYPVYKAEFDVVLSHEDSVVDWGDGTDPAKVYYHEYEPGSGTTVATDEHGNVEQWVVRIKFGSNLEDATEHLYSFTGSIKYKTQQKTQIRAAKIGHSAYLKDVLYPDVEHNTQYIAIRNGETVPQIGNCYYLRKVELPDTVTELPNNMFKNAYGLTDVNLSCITKVGDNAFYRCGSLDFETHSMPELVEIGLSAFSYTNIKKVNYPKLTSIGNYAFSNCFNLETVNSETITSIGNYAFSGCYNLQTVNLPCATSIGQRAFSYSWQLQSVEIPTVTTIGEYAFYFCINLNKIIIPSDYEITSYVFADCPNVIIERK